jgi:hypothetical protein
MAFGIDVAPSGQEKSNYNALFGSSAFATGQGEGDITASDQFLRAILSGNNAQIMQLLSPQVNAIKTSAQNQKLSNAEFGNRSGGMVSSNNAIDNTTRGDISGLVGNLTGTAASTLGSHGQGLLGLGMSGNNAAFGQAETMQKQRASQWNDLFNSIASTGEAVMGAIPGKPGGFADKAGNFLGMLNP